MEVDTILHAGEWSSLPDEARRLEEAGFDAAWTAEVSHDPFLPLAVVAAATARISLGTSIAVAFARSPMTTAYTANDLHAASYGDVVDRITVPSGAALPPDRLRDLLAALR